MCRTSSGALLVALSIILGCSSEPASVEAPAAPVASPEGPAAPEPVSTESPAAAAAAVEDLGVQVALSMLGPTVARTSGQPSLSVAPDGAFLLSWLEESSDGQTSLRFARRTPGAPAWSEPVTVASGNNWFVNWADVPSVRAGVGHMAAHWLVRSEEGPGGYDAWVSRSDADGLQWTEPRRLHDDTSLAEHGFVSLLPRSDGSTLAVWLDGRAFAQDKPEMSLRSRILVRNGSLGPEVVVDGRTCDCCPTALAATPGKGALAIWRDRSDTEVRDMASARFTAGVWTPPKVVAQDDWVMPGCPVNGPALAVRGQRAVVAWFTEQGDRPRVQVAFSFDAGATFTTAFPVVEKSPLGRVGVVLLSDGSALVSWLDSGAGGQESGLRLRRVAQDGRREAIVSAATVSGSRATGVPVVASSGGEVMLAWTEPGDAPRVQVGTLALTAIP